MMPNSNILLPVSNYLVPATGSTNAMVFSQYFSSNDPTIIDFRNQSLDGVPFRPYGMIIDNTNGSGDIYVVINEMSLQIIGWSGYWMERPYPAPVDHSVTILGADEVATIVFVDYPLIPVSF